MPGLERRLKAELRGEVRFDRFTRGRYATDASHYQMMPLGVVLPRTIARRRARARDRPRGGGERAGARRRHLAGRPDRQCLAGHRLLEAPRPDRRARRPGPALRGRARHRARRPQSAAAAARPVVPGRHLDRVARHHRRHGGQQFLRRPLAALRQHARQRVVDRRGAGRRRQGAFRAGGARPLRSPRGLGPASDRARPAGDRAARGGGDRGAISQGPAPRRRLQSRRADAGPQRAQSRAYPGRLRRHARLLDRDRAEAFAAAQAARRRRLPFRPLLTRRWTRPSTSSSSARSRSSSSTAP